MILAELLNKVFGISNKHVDHLAPIFAAIIITSGKEYDDEVRKKIQEDAIKLFKDKFLQGFFISQVEFLAKGGANETKDINMLIKIINKNFKNNKKRNFSVPFVLLKKYESGDDLQKRVFEFLESFSKEKSPIKPISQ